MILFHEDNIGKTVDVRGTEQVISSILASRKFFRVESEQNGPLVNDYMIKDITYAEGLLISTDNGNTWQLIAVQSATP